MSTAGVVRRRLFGIPSAKAVFRRKGFAHAAWDKFQPVAESLTEGYHAALESCEPAELAHRLEAVPAEFSGFAFEGVGMGLAALDAVMPWRSLVTDFAAGPAADHIFPFYVGVGLAYARMRSAPEKHLGRLDPIMGWVTADGYGFHEAFFHRHRTVEAHVVPRRLTPFAQRMFDQGIGRAVWFSTGADPVRTTAETAAFPLHRQADVWAGVALASAYGGGSDRAGLESLVRAAGEQGRYLARGAAIASWGRHLAGNPTEHTELACEVYCQSTGAAAAAVVREALTGLPAIGPTSMHELWRERIDASFGTAASRPAALIR